jgi:protocatechuate 3,4-dioxygenase beta subunit
MKSKSVSCLVSIAVVLAGCSGSVAREPVIGGPCEDCDLVFVGMPDPVPSRSRIAPANEPGQPLVIEGTVRNGRGKAVPGIIVYAHHTDPRGIYPSSDTRHGRLRGWAKSDSTGYYRFETIRPGAYPTREFPEHVHMHLIEPGRGVYWIDDINFLDDPLLPDDLRTPGRSGRAGNGVCDPSKDSTGVWHVRRDIELGREIPGYPEPPVDSKELAR